MQLHPNELTIIYDPALPTAKKLRAMAYSITNNVNEIDYTRTRISTTVWKEILYMLGNDPKSLLNKAHPDYQAKVKGNSFTMNGWLDILSNYPHLLRAPIVVTQGKAILCDNCNDILKLGKSTNTPSRKLSHLVRRDA